MSAFSFDYLNDTSITDLLNDDHYSSGYRLIDLVRNNENK